MDNNKVNEIPNKTFEWNDEHLETIRLISSIIDIPNNEVNIPPIYENINKYPEVKNISFKVSWIKTRLKYTKLGSSSIDVFTDIIRVYNTADPYKFYVDKYELLPIFNEFVKYNSHLGLTALTKEDIKNI